MVLRLGIYIEYQNIGNGQGNQEIQIHLYIYIYLVTQHTKEDLATQGTDDGHHGDLGLHIRGQGSVALVLRHHHQGNVDDTVIYNGGRGGWISK